MSSPSASPALDPIACQPWCQNTSADHQCCSGVEHRVHLSTEPNMLMADGSTQQHHLNTHLTRRADDSKTRVFIGHDDGFGKSATLEEARRFAFEILARIDGHKV
jgi:hypothetical protein